MLKTICNVFHQGLLCAALVVLVLLPGALFAQDAALSAVPSAPASRTADYILGVGDKVRVTVFGEADLSGEFEISSTGMLSMPLIGEVKASGATTTGLKTTITNKLLDGYMKDPKVSLEVLNYRPFFIVGEVMKPGSYNYVNGMSVINAIALAGGYTYRADKDDIVVKRGGENGKEEKVKEDAIVRPGDVVTVPERFF